MVTPPIPHNIIQHTDMYLPVKSVSPISNISNIKGNITDTTTNSLWTAVFTYCHWHYLITYGFVVFHHVKKNENAPSAPPGGTGTKMTWWIQPQPNSR